MRSCAETRPTNLDAEAVIATAKSFSVPSTVLLTAAYARHAGSPWRLVVAKLSAATDQASEKHEIYPEHGFAFRIINDFSLDQFMKDLVGDGCLVSAAFPPIKKADTTTLQWTDELVPSHITESFPVRRFRVKLSTMGFLHK